METASQLSPSASTGTAQPNKATETGVERQRGYPLRLKPENGLLTASEDPNSGGSPGSLPLFQSSHYSVNSWDSLLTTPGVQHPGGVGQHAGRQQGLYPRCLYCVVLVEAGCPYVVQAGPELPISCFCLRCWHYGCSPPSLVPFASQGRSDPSWGSRSLERG